MTSNGVGITLAAILLVLVALGFVMEIRARYSQAEVDRLIADAVRAAEAATKDRVHEQHVAVWRKQMALWGIPTIDLSVDPVPAHATTIIVEAVQ